MGMDADIIAIGKFKRELIPYLDYPEEFYEDTPEGAEIVTSLFCCSTTSLSERLATAVGIDPWKFEECHLDPARFDWEQLAEITGVEYEEDIGYSDLELLRKFVEAGFQLYYRPNG